MSSTSEKEPNTSSNIESINEIERNTDDVVTPNNNDQEPNVKIETKEPTVESTVPAQNDDRDKLKSTIQMQQRSSNLVKMTSKPVVLSKQGNVVTTNASKTNSNNLTGQIVFIQSPGGTKQPIRITTANSSGLPVIKTSNSNALQQLQEKKVELTQTTNTKSSETKKIANASVSLHHDKNNRHIVLESAPLAIKATSVPLINTAANNVVNKNLIGSTSVTNTLPKRTITVSQAQQMGIISSEKLKELVSAAANKNQLFNSSANKMVNPQQKMIILNKTKQQQLGLSNLILQTSDNKIVGNEQKPTTISQQNLIKLAQGGQIRTVNVAGKGVQYVRVFTTSSENRSSTSVTTTTNVAGGMGNSISTKTITSNKFSTNVTPHDGQHKLILKGGEKFTFLKTINSSTSIKPVYTLGNVNQQGKQIMQSTSTPKKKLSFTTIPSKSQLIETQQIIENNRANDMVILNSHLKDRRIALVTQKSDDERDIDDNSSLTSNKDGLIPRKYQLFGGIKKEVTENTQSHQLTTPTPDESVDDGLRRKHCNCTKSQCLKLYCDCFANGEFCSNCNCKECFNNLENEGERQKAIRMCLERNPHAFKPKIGKTRDKNDALRRHTKGCNCKRSGCLKNYCECYEAKIICSENCKCHGCRNIDESFDHKSMIDSSTVKNNSDDYNDSNINNSVHGDTSKQIKMNAATEQSKLKGIKRSLIGNVNERCPPSPIPAKKTCNFMTQDVIEATVQCIIAQADECLRNNYDIKTSERMLIEEFGRCLVEIIDYSMKSNDG